MTRIKTEAPSGITAFYSGTFGARGYWRPEPDDLAMPKDAIMPTRYVRDDLVPDWLPMDTAPNFEDVLVSVSDMVSIGYRKGDIGWFCSTTGQKYHGSPDGWQPLPSPAAKTEEVK